MPSTTHCLAELRHLLLRRYLPASVTNPQRFVTDAGCGSGTRRLRRKIPLLFGEKSLNFKNSGVRSRRSCRKCEQGLYPKIRDRNLPGKISAGIPDSLAPELLQILTSSLARLFN